MVKRFPFALGWRPIGSSKRRWQLQDCVDVAAAARLAAGLTEFDGGGRWCELLSGYRNTGTPPRSRGSRTGRTAGAFPLRYTPALAGKT